MDRSFLPVLGSALSHGPWIAAAASFAVTPGALWLLALLLERRRMGVRGEFLAIFLGDPLLAAAVALGVGRLHGRAPAGLAGPPYAVAFLAGCLGFGLVQWRAELRSGFFTREQALAPTKIWHQLLVYPLLGYWLWTAVLGALTTDGPADVSAEVLMILCVLVWLASNGYDRRHPKLGHPPYEWRRLRPGAGRGRPPPRRCAPTGTPDCAAERPHSAQEAAQQGRSGLQVLLGDPAGRLRVAAEDRLGDRLVLLGGVLDVAVDHRDRVQQVVEPHPGLGDAAGQRVRAGELGDRQVEARVALPVGIRGGGLQIGQPALQVGSLIIRQLTPGGSLGGAGLQDQTVGQRVLQLGAQVLGGPAQVAQVGRGQPVGDEGAAIPATPRLHAAGVLQGAQRLTERHPADVQPHGQLAFGRQSVAVAEDAELDRLKDPLDGLLEGIARPNRTEDRAAWPIHPHVLPVWLAHSRIVPVCSIFPGSWRCRALDGACAGVNHTQNANGLFLAH